MKRALEIACLHGVTAYDACYIALSERNGVPLLTADTRLADHLWADTRLKVTEEPLATRLAPRETPSQNASST